MSKLLKETLEHWNEEENINLTDLQIESLIEIINAFNDGYSTIYGESYGGSIPNSISINVHNNIIEKNTNNFNNIIIEKDREIKELKDNIKYYKCKNCGN